MRPTRLDGAMRGLLSKGFGIDPTVVTTDPEPPTDRASSDNGGLAYVPFLVTGAAAVVQYATGLGAGFVAFDVTLTNAPTIGNVLVASVASETDNGPTFSLDNGTWTEIGTVYSGNGTNLPNRLYWTVVNSSTDVTTTISRSGGTGIGDGKAVIVELSGVDTLDADIASANNTSSTTDTITPTAGLPAVLISATFSRSGTVPVMSPAGSMTELVEIGTARPLAVNYQEVDPTVGSYTVGSSGAGSNASMIGAAFEDTGESIVWVDAPLTIDGDDATYDYAYDTDIEEFWRADLGDTYLIGSMTARLAFDTAGSNPVLLQGANEADYSDAVTIATIPVTATGSFTAQDISDSWTPTAVYRYWQLVLTTPDSIRVHEVELFDADTDGGGVTVHEDLTGRDAADQHPADAVTVTDTAGWLDGATEVEAALAGLAAKVVGYQAHGNTGTTETFDAALGWHSATLNANCTFTLTANPTGTVSSLFLELAQDGTGGWTITLPASVTNKTELEADQDTTLSTTSLLVLLSRDGGTTWYGGWWGGSGGSDLTIEDEGTPLATAATTLDFVGAGVVASGATGDKTITISGAPTGAAGGDLSGTYPNPSVVDDSHSHTGATAPGSDNAVGPILITDTPAGSPLIFGDLLQNEAGDDLLYADI